MTDPNDHEKSVVRKLTTDFFVNIEQALQTTLGESNRHHTFKSYQKSSPLKLLSKAFNKQALQLFVNEDYHLKLFCGRLLAWHCFEKSRSATPWYAKSIIRPLALPSTFKTIQPVRARTGYTLKTCTFHRTNGARVMVKHY